MVDGQHNIIQNLLGLSEPKNPRWIVRHGEILHEPGGIVVCLENHEICEIGSKIKKGDSMEKFVESMINFRPNQNKPNQTNTNLKCGICEADYTLTWIDFDRGRMVDFLLVKNSN